MTPVKVREPHIWLGKRGSAFGCPISLAIAEATGLITVTGNNYSILHSRSYWGDRIPEMMAKLPSEACDFISLYDRKGPEHVQPIEFGIEIVPYLDAYVDRSYRRAHQVRQEM